MKGLTRDNPHLSEATLADWLEPTAPGFAVNCKSLQEFTDTELAGKLRQLIQAANSINTRRAYRSDLAHFLANGGKLPSSSNDVAAYLARHAGQLAVATLARRLVAISRAHTSLGLANPCRAELVRLTLRGIRRTYGRPQQQALALGKDALRMIAESLGSSVRGSRDRALLLLGFHGAFRRSELIAIDCKSIAWSGPGIVVTVRKSKTDQERKGRDVPIGRRAGVTCPVEALERWIQLSKIVEGPVFRRIGRAENILEQALSANAVSAILKQRLHELGRDSSGYSGHSLRAGFVTEAVNAGIPNWKIRRQTGHSSDAMLDRYIRQVDAFSDPWKI